MNIFELDNTLNIVFWNVSKNFKIIDYLIKLVFEFKVKILILAEIEEITLLNLIEQYKKFSKKDIRILRNEKIVFIIFSNDLRINETNDLYKNKRWYSIQIKTYNNIKFNIFGVHLTSQLNTTSKSISYDCINLRNSIVSVEKKYKSENTIIAGDFNLNPFDDGIIASNGLHALQDLNYLELKKKRIVDNNEYNYFYNPMWQFFGDKEKPLGTYYYRNSSTLSLEWHIFDQFIFSPNIKKYLTNNYVDIITKIKEDNLLEEKYFRPKESISNHLPIILKLRG